MKLVRREASRLFQLLPVNLFISFCRESLTLCCLLSELLRGSGKRIRYCSGVWGFEVLVCVWKREEVSWRSSCFHHLFWQFAGTFRNAFDTFSLKTESNIYLSVFRVFSIFSFQYCVVHAGTAISVPSVAERAAYHCALPLQSAALTGAPFPAVVLHHGRMGFR